MRIFTFILLLILNATTVFSQDARIKQTASFIDIDLQGNIYLIDKTTLSKFDINGQFMFSYSNAILGDIESIDAGNPLRLLLFYHESNTLVFLNQQLTEIGDPIDLTLFTNGEITLAGLSHTGAFWLFDATSLSLKQYSSDRTLIRQSENISYLLNNEQPTYLTEQNKQVYLQTPSKVFVFDLYGNLLHQIPLSSPNKITLTQQAAYTFINQEFIEYNRATRLTSTKKITGYPTAKNAILYKSMLILQLESEVDIFNGVDLNGQQ